MTKENQQEMLIPQAKQSQRYGIEVEGGWGEFYTASSKVLYVSSNARFTNEPKNDHEHSLIKHLTPVREIIKTKDVAFSELLQRDLDDFRVAEDMIPYLLSDSVKGPVFFPPILAVLIPYKNGETSEIEEIKTQLADANSPDDERKMYEDLVAGPVFKLSRLVYQGNLSRTTRHAKLRWNDTHAKLVVIDGQHRAMALLAIYRTLRQAWESHTGSEYKHFYEEKINRLVKGDFPEIEVPVTIAIFPELFGVRGGEIHTAARKLFVDVNKQAKAPSASRLILLSDQGLVNVLTRMMLEKVRERDSELKELGQSGSSLLVTIEYDSHSTSEKEYAWQRPTAMTNLNLLRTVIEISVACKSAFREKIPASYKGLIGPTFDLIKKCLDLEQQLGQYPKVSINGVDTPTNLDEFNLEYCPSGIQEKIFKLFYEKIGIVIDGVLRGAQPYSAHVVATEKLENLLGDVALEEKLVRQALFDGVGTYWTLKNFGEDFEKGNVGLNANEKQVRELRASPAVRSWKEVGKAKDTLLEEVAQQLLGSASKEDIANIKALKSKTETMACEIGLIMTAIHIQSLYKLQVKDSDSFVKIFCKYINKAHDGVSKMGANKALIMTGNNNVESLFNFLNKLNPRNWLEFRCLWIELLAENQDEFEQEMVDTFKAGTDVSLSQSIQGARKALYELFEKEIKQKNRDAWKDNIDELAAELALGKRFAAMEYWLDWSKDKFSEEYKAVEVSGKWSRVRNINAPNRAIVAPDDDQENGDDEEADEEN